MKSKTIFAYMFFMLAFSGCSTVMNFETVHGATQDYSQIKEGQTIDYVIKTLGQETLISNNSNSIYYISSSAKHAYFLRPKLIKYKIMKIDFVNQKVTKITTSFHEARYNREFAKKLKSQDKIKIEDFFKEVVGTSNFVPGR